MGMFADLNWDCSLTSSTIYCADLCPFVPSLWNVTYCCMQLFPQTGPDSWPQFRPRSIRAFSDIWSFGPGRSWPRRQPPGDPRCSSWCWTGAVLHSCSSLRRLWGAPQGNVHRAAAAGLRAAGTSNGLYWPGAALPQCTGGFVSFYFMHSHLGQPYRVHFRSNP